MEARAPMTKCSECPKGYAYMTTAAMDLPVRHGGKDYVVHIPDLIVGKCDCCGEVYLDNRADDQIQSALRGSVGLPEGPATSKPRGAAK